ncbi:MAG: aldehyde dehydrogenase [Spirochaetales bacterium]|nr:aldehyde dehydrogenase [Spirochaetales bacterium]
MDPHRYISEKPYPLYIGGEFVSAVSEKTFSLVNPATGEAFASAALGGRADMERAMTAAREAFDSGPWAAMTGRDRSSLLLKTTDILEKRAEEFACAETLDCGKIYQSVLHFELPNSLDGIRYHAAKARCLEGKTVPLGSGKDCFNYVTWHPRGVVGEILPWNGPLMMGCQKISAILAAGNTVIVKPASWASLSMLKMAEVFHQAGFPPGVVNVVTGSGQETGSALMESPLVDMVSLTGGTETGKKLLAGSVKTVKDLALELGGKSPNIVFHDADMEKAVPWAARAFTLNSGQVCVSGTRLLLHREIYDVFLEKLKIYCETSFRPGDGFHPEVNYSSLISREHAESVWRHIEAGKKEGARLVCGGEPYADPALAKGSFVPPTIFADVSPDMSIYREEIFGPVLCVTPFNSEEEALTLANGTAYGLAGGVFTSHIGRAHRVAGRLKAGQVYINSYFSRGMVESPGTGWKESGIGGAGIYKYMLPKTVFTDLS